MGNRTALQQPNIILNVTMDFPNSKELPAVELCRRWTSESGNYPAGPILLYGKPFLK